MTSPSAVKVHLVLPQLLPYYGMENAAGLLLRALHNNGFDVSATVLSGDVPEHLRDLSLNTLQIAKRSTRLIEAIGPLRRAVSALPADCHIVASGAWAAAPLGVALVGSRRRYISWEHSALPARLRADRKLALLFRLSHFAPFRPASVVAVSDGVRDYVRLYAPKARVSTIPNIVETRARRVSRSTSDRWVTVCSIGAFRKLKNYAVAVECLAALPDHYRLVMAGDGPDRPEIERTIDRLRLRGRVQLLGHIGDVRPVLEAADVLVHPSEAETFGFTLIEAAEASVPVVANAAPAMTELVPHLVPGRLSAPTPQDLARSILLVTGGDGPSATEFAEAARARDGVFRSAGVADAWGRFLVDAERAGGPSQ